MSERVPSHGGAGSTTDGQPFICLGEDFSFLDLDARNLAGGINLLEVGIAYDMFLRRFNLRHPKFSRLDRDSWSSPLHSLIGETSCTFPPVA